MHKIFDQIARSTAVISGIFIFIGIFRAGLYYLPFNIAIHTFIDLGEVFTIWFPDTIWGIILLSGLAAPLSLIQQLNSSHKDYHLIHIFLYVLHILILLYVLTNFVFNWYGRNSIEKLEFIKVYAHLILIIGLFYTPILISAMFKAIKVWRAKTDDVKFSRTEASINILTIMLYFTILSVVPMSTVVTRPKASLIMELKSDDLTIRTNDTLRYIGKTRNYIFLWNNQSKASTIYPIEQFDQITILPR